MYFLPSRPQLQPNEGQSDPGHRIEACRNRL